MNRWKALAGLTAEEEQAISALTDKTMFVQSGKVLRKQGDSVTGVYLLQQGWVVSSIALSDNRRLIQKVHLAGDMLGTPSMALVEAADTLVTVTDATVAFVPFERIAALYSATPRLAAVYTLAAMAESVALIDSLAATARMSAAERLARLLLDFYKRLSAIGEVKENAFNLPLNQEAIGDLTGLTNVHVSRILSKLCRDGVISRERHMIRITDINALRKLSPLSTRTINFQPRWLPAPR